MAVDRATILRRIRRLRHPLSLFRSRFGTWRYQRSIAGKLRTQMDRPEGAAVLVQRPRRTFPTSPEELRKASFFTDWWYYDAELLPGVSAKGIYPPELPMLPRIMLRQCDPAGKSVLDIGSMEGLVPVLMKRRGADRVLAVDAIDFCAEKMAALKHYYDVEFDLKTVGLMYDLDKKLGGEGFDIVNCSGLLYHVWSPMSVLAGVRPLLKRNGLLVVSTGVIRDEGHFMEFNNAGRIQEESNTFWYLSLPLLDYMLRYLALAPIDCSFTWHSSLAQPHVRLRFDKPSGYVSIVCRAVDGVLPSPDDQWMNRSARDSWEHRGLVDWQLARRQPVSSAAYLRPPNREAWREETHSLDLWKAAQLLPDIAEVSNLEDSHTLRLSHLS